MSEFNDIDMPTLPKPIGSLQELHPEFAKVLNENFLELISDDAHTENRTGCIDNLSDSRELETLDKLENHISPNCKVEDM
ncbi:putative DnaJ-class molecular chaperone [Acinetobacter phage Herod]|nr:putative DnaJ-class molecular chaperone [Acinetobacter phage Herod]